MLFREHQTVNTFHQVTDVAKTAGLCPVSVDRQGFAVQRLLDEVWHHASVIQAHAGAKGIENPDDAGIQVVETQIRHRQRFREAFGFVVHRARSDRIAVAPIAFDLRVHLWVAINLAGGSQQVAGFVGFCQSKRVQRAQGAGF